MRHRKGFLSRITPTERRSYSVRQYGWNTINWVGYLAANLTHLGLLKEKWWKWTYRWIFEVHSPENIKFLSQKSECVWLLDVTFNDISIIYVTVHVCAGRLKKFQQEHNYARFQKGRDYVSGGVSVPCRRRVLIVYGQTTEFPLIFVRGERHIVRKDPRIDHKTSTLTISTFSANPCFRSLVESRIALIHGMLKRT